MGVVVGDVGGVSVMVKGERFVPLGEAGVKVCHDGFEGGGGGWGVFGVDGLVDAHLETVEGYGGS